MALRPRLSAGLLLSVSKLLMFDGRNITTEMEGLVKEFALTIIMDFPAKYHL